jgi:mycobactin phenyloxazoline synthetase
MDTGADRAALTREQLLHKVAGIVGLAPEEISGTTDLAALGLRSLDVMRLVNQWRILGLPVTFAELVAAPTIDDWWSRICELRRAHPYLLLAS